MVLDGAVDLKGNAVGDADLAQLIWLRLPPRGAVCAVNALPWGLPPGS